MATDIRLKISINIILFNAASSEHYWIAVLSPQDIAPAGQRHHLPNYFQQTLPLPLFPRDPYARGDPPRLLCHSLERTAQLVAAVATRTPLARHSLLLFQTHSVAPGVALKRVWSPPHVQTNNVQREA